MRPPAGRAAPQPACSQQAVTRALAAALRSSPWGRPPTLYGVFLQRGECLLLQLRAPRPASALAPAEVLAAAAGTLRDVTAAPPPGLDGIAFCFEVRDPGPAGSGPGGRYLVAAGRDGTVYKAHQRSGQDHPIAGLSPWRPAPPHPRNHSAPPRRRSTRGTRAVRHHRHRAAAGCGLAGGAIGTPDLDRPALFLAG